MKNEAIEWFNYWSEYADEEKVRFLMIGDSIIWGGRTSAAKSLPEGFAATTIATSRGVDDEQFVKIVGNLATLDGFKYEVVYFNNGLHPHGQSPEVYAENYKKAVRELMNITPNAVWVLGLSTPIADNPKSGEAYDTPITDKQKADTVEKNALVLAYNEKVRNIAGELGLEFFDAYSLLEGKNEWKTDSYHYNNEGRTLFGNAVANVMISAYQKKNNK